MSYRFHFILEKKLRYEKLKFDTILNSHRYEMAFHNVNVLTSGKRSIQLHIKMNIWKFFHIMHSCLNKPIT